MTPFPRFFRANKSWSSIFYSTKIMQYALKAKPLDQKVEGFYVQKLLIN